MRWALLHLFSRKMKLRSFIPFAKANADARIKIQGCLTLKFVSFDLWTSNQLPLTYTTGAGSAPKSHTKLISFLIDIASLKIFEPTIKWLPDLLIFSSSSKSLEPFIVLQMQWWALITTLHALLWMCFDFSLFFLNCTLRREHNIQIQWAENRVTQGSASLIQAYPDNNASGTCIRFFSKHITESQIKYPSQFHIDYN